MILESIKYTRCKGKTKEWSIIGRDNDAVHFGNINLIVGKNSAGKSRTLVLIEDIANLLATRKPITSIRFSDWSYSLQFKYDNNIYIYELSVDNETIKDERILINGDIKLDRKVNKIYSEKDNQFDPITISDTEVITHIRDYTKYPFLEKLFEWGNVLRKYIFTNQHEKNYLLEDGYIENLKDKEDLSPKNTIELFYKGEEVFGKNFTDAIISDMKRVEYEINKISIEATNLGSGISVQEEELSEATSQLDMSQGMFRALSFIIQLNYALFGKTSVCLLIDDLGEGLDFSRSKALIDMLIYKINNSNIQIFITTNDRYIMNKIPIRYWSILERKAKISIIYNYFNSKDIFEDYKYTGLNNFDFLATSFYLKGFGSDLEEERDNEKDNS